MGSGEHRTRAGRAGRVWGFLILLVCLAGLGAPFAAEWPSRAPSVRVLPETSESTDRVCRTTGRYGNGVGGEPRNQFLHPVQHCTASNLGAPQNLMADGTSPTQISLSWQAGTGTVHHYEVWRSRATESLLLTTTTSPLLTDQNLPANTAYVYRVRAVDSTGGVSPFSHASLGTTIVFSEAIQQFVTTVKAQHLTELRPAIDAVRTCAGLPGAAWGPAPQVGGTILAAHVQELRDQLAPALQALGLPALAAETLVPQSTMIKKAHIQELRDAVK